ncbi:hypothetical protein HanPI659440_Chr16g0660131 [Helianthus annuus]|nr:hypothetical protein HanPI659440_Chr16g0660131 [Helianthus annuus]
MMKTGEWSCGGRRWLTTEMLSMVTGERTTMMKTRDDISDDNYISRMMLIDESDDMMIMKVIVPDGMSGWMMMMMIE